MSIRISTSAAALAAGVLLTGCDQIQAWTGSSGSPAADPIEAADVPAEVAMPELGTEILLKMDCAPLSTSEGFSREIVLTRANSVYTYQRGEKETTRYEFWKLEVTGPGSFAIVGEYIEGTPNLKTLEFTGAIDGDELRGEGKRGPRNCTVSS
ncbi:MAG: hypothetical protein KDA53_11940 [Hyphomonas sp.]|nr:hypothetical protein [Hyphomonas sp.]